MKIFKLLSVLMFVALSAGFASCSDDDDKTDELVGTWLETKNQQTIKYENGDPDKVKEPEIVTDGVQVTFNSDNTGFNTIVYDEAGNTRDYPFTWKRKGNELIINGANMEASLGEIVSLNSNELVLKSTFDDGDIFIDTTTYTRVK